MSVMVLRGLGLEVGDRGVVSCCIQQAAGAAGPPHGGLLGVEDDGRIFCYVFLSVVSTTVSRGAAGLALDRVHPYIRSSRQNSFPVPACPSLDHVLRQSTWKKVVVVAKSRLLFLLTW